MDTAIAIFSFAVLFIIFKCISIFKDRKEKQKIKIYKDAYQNAKHEFEYQYIQTKNKLQGEYDELKKNLKDEYDLLKEEIEYKHYESEKELNDEKCRLKKYEENLKQQKKIQDKLFEEKTKGFPYIAEYYSTYCEKIGALYDEYLSLKMAYTSAEIVRKLTKKLKEIEKLYFKNKAILDYYEHSFPWLKHTLGVPDEEIGQFPPYIQRDINNEWKKIHEAYGEIKKAKIQNEQYENTLKERAILQEKLFEEKTKGFPWVAERFAEIKDAERKESEIYLRTKKQPAIQAARTLKEYGIRLREAEKNSFIYKGILEYYESLFPWLSDFRDAPDETICQAEISATDDDDPAGKFLSRSEWNNLSKTEKFQKALDRYKMRHKTNWEIGRDFERFVGYEYECDGWNVSFHGAIKGFEDMGRDLIVKKGNSVKIIQCKYWAKDKIIHEKHIFQLFGTCVTYSIDTGSINQQSLLSHQSSVEGIFISSCALSETAKKVASILGIKFIEFKKLENYPCIKCNIGKTGEKIYHLPFDQNYDKVKIDMNNGEFYCETVKEAEDAGFRRAYKWRGKTS